MVFKRRGKQERSAGGNTRMIHVRLTEAEYNEWLRRSQLLGITLSDFIRQTVRKSVTEVIIKKEINIDPLVDIAGQYGKIGNNLNQIAHYLNSTSIWSQRLRDNLADNLREMYFTTKKLAKVVDEINGDYKTQSNERFRL